MGKSDAENAQREPALDYSLSVKVARLIQAEKYCCWYNARDALQQLPGLLPFAAYTEGWLVVPKEREIQVIEHGWISRADGRVVDPSIVLLEKSDQGLTYFPGIHVLWSDVYELSGIPLPVAHLFSPEDELGHPDYRAAYNAALAQASQLAEASGKRVKVCPCQKIIIAVTKGGTVIITS